MIFKLLGMGWGLGGTYWSMGAYYIEYGLLIKVLLKRYFINIQKLNLNIFDLFIFYDMI